MSYECRSGKYHKFEHWDKHLARRLVSARLTPMAVASAPIFAAIASKQKLPAKPYPSGTGRFLCETETALGFQGIGGKDLSMLFHLIIVPKVENFIGKSEFPRWVFDLNSGHATMLRKMRLAGLEFVKVNYVWFRALKHGKQMKGHDTDFWLREENIQFGFHSIPRYS